MADYWIKLYHEILDDPKMATLPDRLYRRAIEIFLLAGRLCKDKSGNLPETNQLAWMLRMQTDDLDMDLKQLQISGIIQKTSTGWMVVSFEKRQGPASAAERKKRERDDKQSRQYHDNVTTPSRNVTENTESETESESETETDKAAAAVYTAYQKNIGSLTGIISEKLEDDIRDYTAGWVIDAIVEATVKEKRSLAYAEGILKSWKRDGRGNKKNSSTSRDPSYDEKVRKLYAEP